MGPIHRPDRAGIVGAHRLCPLSSAIIRRPDRKRQRRRKHSNMDCQLIIALNTAVMATAKPVAALIPLSAVFLDSSNERIKIKQVGFDLKATWLNLKNSFWGDYVAY